MRGENTVELFKMLMMTDILFQQQQRPDLSRLLQMQAGAGAGALPPGFPGPQGLSGLPGLSGVPSAGVCLTAKLSIIEFPFREILRLSSLVV